MKKEPDNTRPLAYVLFKKYGVRGALRVLVEDVLFDYYHRVDTFRPVSNKKLFHGGNIDEQNRYVPSTIASISSIMEVLQEWIALEDCEFVDLGSGKGKALIAAANWPFQHLTGIELSPQLHNTAKTNIERLDLTKKITLLQQDAAEYQFKPNEQVLFFFNPFTGQVLERCLENVTRDGITRFVAYMNPTEDEVYCKHLKKIAHRHFQPGDVEVCFYKTP